MALVADIVDGDIEEFEGVITHRRVYLVTGVGGSASSRAWNARQTAGVPRRSDPHPAIPGAVVTGVRVVPEQKDPAAFRVTVTYSTAGAGTGGLPVYSLADPVEVSFAASSLQERVINDRFGNRIRSVYRSAGSTLFTYHRVEVERPTVLISITRTVSTRPDDLNRAYGGRCNQDNWSGYARYQVRCDGFTGTSGQAGLWRVTGTFVPAATQHGTWEAVVLHNAGGFVPADVRTGNGRAFFEPYPVATFTRSGFSL